MNEVTDDELLSVYNMLKQFIASLESQVESESAE